MAEMPASSQYSSGIAFIYIFNLVIGTGVLALPSVLIYGGWLLGGIFMVLVAFLSYVSLTFMLESMATTNALIRLERQESPTEHTYLLPRVESYIDKDPYDITEKTELGQMANLYYNQMGLIMFFTVLILYLFGDGVIYSTVVVRSLLTFIYGDNEPYWAFDLFLCIFAVCILPFCFFDFQKTKMLQVVTMVIRNVSLFTIIALAFRVARKGEHSIKEVPVFNIGALPNLFGGAVYSFMCHHSMPSIITPMKDKSRIMKLTAIAFGLVLGLYIVLFVTCLFAFGLDVLDPITFNFPVKTYGYVGDALVLFPVFTLSSNYPMLLITLRNNLDNLFHLMQKSMVTSRGNRQPESQKPEKALHLRRVVLTLIAVVPPMICAFLAEHFGLSVDELVGATGAFAGCIIMFIIPATLVYYSRRRDNSIIPCASAFTRSSRWLSAPTFAFLLPMFSLFNVPSICGHCKLRSTPSSSSLSNYRTYGQKAVASFIVYHLALIVRLVLLIAARVLTAKINSSGGPLKTFPIVNTHASPFGGDIWVYVVLVWASVSMVFNAVEKFSMWYI